MLTNPFITTKMNQVLWDDRHVYKELFIINYDFFCGIGVHVCFYFLADILLLDEPTTGLDSFTARHLIQSLANIAHKGKMVILTVHQPRSDIFKLLDNVCILSNGQTIYCGGCNELVSHFGDVGYPCPNYANPLDYYGKQP